MIPTSAKGLHRFTPDSVKSLPSPPVYLLQIPTRALRHIYDRELIAAGVTHYHVTALYARAREVVAKLDIDNRDDILALISRLTARALVTDGDGADDDAQVEADQQANDLADWRGIDMMVRDVDPQLRRMVAANRFYMNMAPIIAARVFVAGWENRAAAFKRGPDDLMDEALTESIGDDELNELWLEIMTLMRPKDADVKNSESRPPLPPDQATSTAAKPRQTAARGKSAGTATPATQK
jgi:hypothetical protein